MARAADGRQLQGPLPGWWSWVALGIFFLFVHGASALLTLSNRDVLQGPTVLLRFASVFLVWQWMEQECRGRVGTYPLDMGLFIYAVGPVLVPYYMWRTQRWKGLLKTAGLVVMWAAAYLVASGLGYSISAFAAE